MSLDFDQILARVSGVFAAELGAPVTLTAETTAQDVEGWDSLTHMALIHGVEAEFGLTFKLPEIMRMKNVGDLVRTIEKRLAG